MERSDMSHPQPTRKRRYQSPQLAVYGNLTSLTQTIADIGNIDGAGMSAVPNRTI